MCLAWESRWVCRGRRRDRSRWYRTSEQSIDDKGRTDQLGVEQRLANHRRSSQPDEAVSAERGDRPIGAEGNRGERGDQEARGKVGEGVGRELRRRRA